MALRMRKTAPLEALAILRSARSADELGRHFDEVFGDRTWETARIEDAAKAISDAVERGASYLVIAVDSEGSGELAAATAAIAAARSAKLRVLLLAEQITPAGMHELLRAGAEDFAPLPLAPGVLAEAVDRLKRPVSGGLTANGEGSGKRSGQIHTCFGVAGGVGASTLAINLAWEMATELRKGAEKVCILDFNFQFGSVATYLDLPRREAIYDLLSDTAGLDEEGFSQALSTYASSLSVLTAPMDALPLDIVGPEDVGRILDVARHSFDHVVVDMPSTLADWSDLVLVESTNFYAVMEGDMRSAQNMLRFLRTIRAEDLPLDHVSPVLNRAPGFTDIAGKSRAKKLAASLGVEFTLRLSDGGNAVAASCDQGQPLAQGARSNALRKEIRGLAVEITKAGEVAKSA